MCFVSHQFSLQQACNTHLHCCAEGKDCIANTDDTHAVLCRRVLMFVKLHWQQKKQKRVHWLSIAHVKVSRLGFHVANTSVGSAGHR